MEHTNIDDRVKFCKNDKCKLGIKEIKKAEEACILSSNLVVNDDRRKRVIIKAKRDVIERAREDIFFFIETICGISIPNWKKKIIIKMLGLKKGDESCENDKHNKRATE